MSEELKRLRKERAELHKEIGQIVLGKHDHSNAKDGVDYKYMRAVRIQQLDKEIKAKTREIVSCLT